MVVGNNPPPAKKIALSEERELASMIVYVLIEPPYGNSRACRAATERSESILCTPARCNLRRVQHSLKNDAILFRPLLQSTQLFCRCLRRIKVELHPNGFETDRHLFRNPQRSLQVHVTADRYFDLPRWDTHGSGN